MRDFRRVLPLNENTLQLVIFSWLIALSTPEEKNMS